MVPLVEIAHGSAHGIWGPLPGEWQPMNRSAVLNVGSSETERTRIHAAEDDMSPKLRRLIFILPLCFAYIDLCASAVFAASNETTINFDNLAAGEDVPNLPELVFVAEPGFFRPKVFRPVQPGEANSPPNVARLDNCVGCEFFTPAAKGRFTVPHQRMSVAVGESSIPNATSPDRAELTLSAFKADGTTLIGTSKATVVAGQGFHTILAITSLSPKPDILFFTLTARDNLDTNKPVGFDDLTFDNPSAAPDPDFTISAEIAVAAGGVSLLPGGHASLPVTIDRVNSSGPIQLAITNLPSGVTGEFAPNPASGATTTLVLSARQEVSRSGSAASVTGVPLSPAAGRDAHHFKINVSTDVFFTLIAGAPGNLTCDPAGTQIRLGVVRNFGFTGIVALTASGLPPGFEASFNPPSLTFPAGAAQDNSILTLKTPPGTLPGDFIPDSVIQVRAIADPQPGASTIALDLHSLCQKTLEAVGGFFDGSPPYKPYSNPNPSFSLSSAWAKGSCSGKRWMADQSLVERTEVPKYEWTPILTPNVEIEDRVVGMSGVAVNPSPSDDDIWFTHPFGFDFMLYVLADDPYQPLISPVQTLDGEFAKANNIASRQLGLADSRLLTASISGLLLPHLLGVEMDVGLLPENFRVRKTGDRVAVFGRWIADCAHNDFHSEIHPPLLLVQAGESQQGEVTHSTVIGRPFLVSQEFEGQGLYLHLRDQLAKVFPPGSPVPGILQISARPKIFRVPFSGIQVMSYVLRPPLGRMSPTDELMVTFQFTIRTGVSLLVKHHPEDDSLSVVVIFNDVSYLPANLAAPHTSIIPIDVLEQHQPEIKPLITFIQASGGMLGLLAGEAVLNNGVETDSYTIGSFVDQPTMTVPAADLPATTPVTVDDAQPFPIRGTIDVGWRRGGPIVASPLPLIPPDR
jgi:hypothetical protein